MAELGCGEARAFLVPTCRNGAGNIALSDAREIEWERKLDDISQAKVIVPVRNNVECCTRLRDVYPWCWNLEIYRDDDLVWEGPVTSVIYRTNEVEIEALDALAWLLVRIPTGVLDNSAGAGSEITDLALDVLEGAFGVQGLNGASGDPCVLQNVIQTDLANRPTRYSQTKVTAEKFPAYEDNYFSWLVLLSQAGLDFTVVAGRVLLGVDSPGLGTLGTLMDHHIVGDIEIHRDGFNQGNRVYVRYFQDDQPETCNPATTPCPAISEADDFFCFGPIEKLISDGGEFDFTTAKQTGEGYIRSSSITPSLIEIPNGARLTSDVPWEINQMIPGVQINVAIEESCFPIADSYQLLEVHYRIDQNQQEEIRVTLGELDRFTGLT